MMKEPKKSDSSPIATSKTYAKDTTGSSREQGSNSSAKTNRNSRFKNSPLKEGLDELRAFAHLDDRYLHLNYFTIFWLFVGGSVIGLGLETLYHAIVFGGFESRAGLVWGPFSPIYGVGAVALTLFLNRYYHSHNVIIFLIAMLVGSLIEYIASWGMELFWGAIAWDYTGTFGNIQGRTNFFFGVMWGMLGLVWVRIIMPVVKKLFDLIPEKNKIAQAFTLLLSVFMALNIAATCVALLRAKERSHDIPASNPIQQICDDVFPDSFINARFENMTIEPRKS